jgi:hypothetical protein
MIRRISLYRQRKKYSAFALTVFTIHINLLLVQLQERQLARFYNLNPSAYPSPEETLEDKLVDAVVTEEEKGRILELADLMKNSSLIKHYEGLIQQFEGDFEVKAS